MKHYREFCIRELLKMKNFDSFVNSFSSSMEISEFCSDEHCNYHL